ncbi:MAG: hypothetical protein RIB43_11840 [Rhodospirillaceae bacterium]
MFDIGSNVAVCKFSGTVKDDNGAVIKTPVITSGDSDRIIDFWLKAAADGWGFRWAVMTRESPASFTGIVGFNTLENCSDGARRYCMTL